MVWKRCLLAVLLCSNGILAADGPTKPLEFSSDVKASLGNQGMGSSGNLNLGASFNPNNVVQMEQPMNPQWGSDVKTFLRNQPPKNPSSNSMVQAEMPPSWQPPRASLSSEFKPNLGNQEMGSDVKTFLRNQPPMDPSSNSVVQAKMSSWQPARPNFSSETKANLGKQRMGQPGNMGSFNFENVMQMKQGNNPSDRKAVMEAAQPPPGSNGFRRNQQSMPSMGSFNQMPQFAPRPMMVGNRPSPQAFQPSNGGSMGAGFDFSSSQPQLPQGDAKMNVQFQKLQPPSGSWQFGRSASSPGM